MRLWENDRVHRASDHHQTHSSGQLLRMPIWIVVGKRSTIQIHSCVAMFFALRTPVACSMKIGGCLWHASRRPNYPHVRTGIAIGAPHCARPHPKESITVLEGGAVYRDVYQCFRVFVAAWIDSSAQVSQHVGELVIFISAHINFLNLLQSVIIQNSQQLNKHFR